MGCAIVICFMAAALNPSRRGAHRVADVGRPRRIPSWLAGSGIIAVAMGVMNLGTYGFTVAAARILGPQEYGAIAAVMGLMLVLGVLSLGFQATAARQVSVAPDDQERTEAHVLAAATRVALALTAITLVASPLISHVVRLESLTAAALLAVALLPLTLMGAYAGVLQGEGRWGALAAVYVGAGAGRLVFGVVGMLITHDTVGALLGVTVGNAVPAATGWWLLRRPADAGRREAPTRESLRGVLTEVAHDCHALLAFFALANVDVIIARWALPAHDAGLYAGGLILTKAVLFLPQFVVVMAFPTMVRDRRRLLRRLALLLVLGIGVAAALAAWLFASWAVVFVGGDAYAELEPIIWAFAVLGALLAMVQLLVYGSMAQQHRASTGVLWGGLVVLLGAAFVVPSLTTLLVVVAVVHTTVLVALIVVGRRELALTG
jgi:O-antigen/teichoic acid export membrane protein